MPDMFAHYDRLSHFLIEARMCIFFREMILYSYLQYKFRRGALKWIH
jgi:hypothetical protein